MNKIKLIVSMALTFVVLFAQAGNAAAAPLAQDPAFITGTVESVVLETDTSGVVTGVLVTLVVNELLGTTQTVRISVATAIDLQLVTQDLVTGEITVIAQIGQFVEIDSATVIPDVTPTEEPVHPLASLLAAFFGEEASVIDDYHTTDGFGFGVIAQALWMSRNLTATEEQAGDASLAGDILQAKQDKNFEAFFTDHPEIIFGGTIPTNWGQFRKVFLNKKNNLGSVVSGHADESTTPALQESGNGNGDSNGQGNGNGNNGNGHGQGNGNSQNKNKGKGN